MTEEAKEKLIKVVGSAINNEDYYTMGRIGTLLTKMCDTNEQLKRITGDEDEEVEPF